MGVSTRIYVLVSQTDNEDHCDLTTWKEGVDEELGNEHVGLRRHIVYDNYGQDIREPGGVSNGRQVTFEKSFECRRREHYTKPTQG